MLTALPGMRSLSRPILVYALSVAPCVSCAATAPLPPASAAAAPVSVAANVASAPPRTAKLEELARRRVDLARARIAEVTASHATGAVSMSVVADAYRDLAVVARDSGLRGEALRQPLPEYRDALEKLRETARRNQQNGMANHLDLLRVDGQVADADFWLQDAAEHP
jgi:hypothetical protein